MDGWMGGLICGSMGWVRSYNFLHKNAIWDRTSPTYTSNASLHVCRRVQGSEIFKQNSIILIRSKVMAFLVILLSPWSPCHPRHPHIMSVLSLFSPHHPHSPQKVPMWSLWLWSPWSPPHVVPIVPVVPMSSPSSPHHCHHPQIPTPPTPTPLGGGGPESVKMQ